MCELNINYVLIRSHSVGPYIITPPKSDECLFLKESACYESSCTMKIAKAGEIVVQEPPCLKMFLTANMHAWGIVQGDPAYFFNLDLF